MGPRNPTWTTAVAEEAAVERWRRLRSTWSRSSGFSEEVEAVVVGSVGSEAPAASGGCGCGGCC